VLILVGREAEPVTLSFVVLVSLLIEFSIVSGKNKGKSMTYETIDWDAEALLVARAFGCDEDCRFEEKLDGEPVKSGLGNERYLCWKIAEEGQEWILKLKGLAEYWNHWYWFPELEEVAFRCTYNKDYGRHFIISPSHETGDTSIEIGWDGDCGCGIGDKALAIRLAKGLFRLGLLSHGTEAELKVTISAHEKLEWVREYEERENTT
jgi:hypothetical protein